MQEYEFLHTNMSCESSFSFQQYNHLLIEEFTKKTIFDRCNYISRDSFLHRKKFYLNSTFSVEK